MGNKPAPKSLGKIEVQDLPPVPSEQVYFEAKKTVLAFELHEFLRDRNFIALEDALHEYGEFLERHPEAENQSQDSKS